MCYHSMAQKYTHRLSGAMCPAGIGVHVDNDGGAAASLFDMGAVVKTK